MNKILIVGSGDVALRAMPWLARRFRVYALVRQTEAAAVWRAHGATPVLADLDCPNSLRRLAGLAERVLYCVSPAERGADDTRMRNFLAALAARGSLPCAMVYISTSGVYGDCQGELVDETRPLRANTARAVRRVAAERRLRAFAKRTGVALRILRAPGIYAATRLPVERVRRGDPALITADDVYTNHIHADDLALAACLALFRGGALRVFNVSDAGHQKMGDWLDAVADAHGLPRPPRLPRGDCEARLSPVMWSFMSESRRLVSQRAGRELRLRLRYPDAAGALALLCPPHLPARS